MKKTKYLIAMILLEIITVPVISQISTAQVSTPIPVILKVYAEPNPVGVNQAVFLSLFFTKPIPIPGSLGGASMYVGLRLNLVYPDGHNETLGPYTSDTTGGVGNIQFTPTVTGNYTVQATYGGQYLNSTSRGLYYYILPTMSEAVTFTVQQDPIPGFPMHPLPAEYWSRPIYATNYEWAAIGGNWWGLYKPAFTDTGGYDASGNNFNPYSQAPNSGHIMWVKPVMFGGQPGNPVSGDQESQYTSTSILYRQFEPVILNGIIFHKLYPNVPTTTSSAFSPGLAAIDLRTGKQIWQIATNEIIVYGWVMNFHSIQEYGTQAFLVTAYNYSMWRLRDPMTGYVIANITDVPGTTAPGLVETDDHSPQGTVYIHDINGTGTTRTLRMWNSTLCVAGTSQVVIRPSGNINYTRGYQWAVPVPYNITVGGVTTLISDPSNTERNPALSIAARTNEAILLRARGQTISTFSAQFGAADEIVCAFDAKTGRLLWGPLNKSFSPLHHEVGVVAAGEGYWVEHDKDTNQAFVFNLLTGEQVGSAIQLKGSALSTLERGGAIAYGKAYIWDFGGYASGINLKNGTLAWTYEPRDAYYNTPYGIYPFWHFGSHSIADGKLFLSESRMYDPPLFPNARKQAINVTDGSSVWSVMGFYGREPSAIADGYMVAFNSYDGQVYTFGKGPTSTTASVRQDVVPFGSSVLVTGAVTDQSSGTKDIDRTARFPNGVAAVSEESESAWMEYVYMQQPLPTNAKGVEVAIDAIDPNSNFVHLGTATSDASSTFACAFTPEVPGLYRIIVTFAGSQSYWPSGAETYVNVEPAPPATAPPEYPQPIDPTMTIIAMGIVLLIAIVIIGIVGILLLRKK